MSNPRLQPATIRLSAAKHHEWSALAYARGITLADLIRERLDLIDPLFESLQRLQQDVDWLKRGQGKPGEGTGGRGIALEATPASESHAIQLEILLLLRGLAPPERRERARAEMERLGVQFWQGKNT